MRISRSEREFHRKTAVQCFNRTWDFLEMRKRTTAQNREMLHLAHASRFHWSLVGSPRNQAVGEWQLSRVYAALGQPRLSLLFANSCLAACRSKRLSDLLPSAYEGIARAYLSAQNLRNSERNIGEARRQLDRLTLDSEDRRIYLGQIRETESLIRKLKFRRRTKSQREASPTST